MKRGIDILLTTIHVGECQRVVTLGINGKNQAEKFLSKLEKDDGRKWDQLNRNIASVSNFQTFENDKIFNHVGNGIFEFKRPGLRLYAFYDELDGETQLILCTNGGSKNNKKEQNKDILRARNLKENYLQAKTAPNTTFTIEEDSDT